MAAEEHSNPEAHLIGSLIDSLSNTGEDEVFFSGGTPNSTLPLAESSSEKLAYDSTTVPSIQAAVSSMPPNAAAAAALPPHMLPYQILRQLQQNQPPPPPFWAPPPPPPQMQFRAAAAAATTRPPFPMHIPPHAAVNLVQQHGRWIPPPQNLYSHQPTTTTTAPSPYAPPIDLQQQYQAYLAYQQQMHDLAAVRMPPVHQPFAAAGLQSMSDNRTCQSQESSGYQQYEPISTTQSGHGEQWESIYTPFGPVRSAGAGFGVDASAVEQRSMTQRLSLVDDPTVTSTLGHDENRGLIDGTITGDRELLKKRSASLSTSTQGRPPASNEMSQVSSTSSSSMHPTTTTNSSSTTAGSPSLPPKGRSYRDVAKSKTEAKGGNARASKKAGGMESQEMTVKGYVVGLRKSVGCRMTQKG